MLAEIEAPELDQQVAQAKSNLQQAQAALEQARQSPAGKANEDLARVTATRWKNLAERARFRARITISTSRNIRSQVATVECARQGDRGRAQQCLREEANVALLEQLQVSAR